MEADWKVFINAKTEQKASKVAHALLAQLSVEVKNFEIVPYHKGGHTASFSTEITAQPWPQAVVGTIAQAQQVGKSWILSGDITTELDAWSNEPSVPGVTNLHVILD